MLSGNRASIEAIKFKWDLLGGLWSNTNGVFTKRGIDTNRNTEGWGGGRTQGEKSSLHQALRPGTNQILTSTFQESMALPTPWLWASGLQSCEAINFCCSELLELLSLWYFVTAALQDPYGLWICVIRATELLDSGLGTHPVLEIVSALVGKPTWASFGPQPLLQGRHWQWCSELLPVLRGDTEPTALSIKRWPFFMDHPVASRQPWAPQHEFAHPQMFPGRKGHSLLWYLQNYWRPWALDSALMPGLSRREGEWAGRARDLFCTVFICTFNSQGGNHIILI